MKEGAGRSGALHNGVCGVIGGSVALPDAAHILQHLCCRLVLDGAPPLHCLNLKSTLCRLLLFLPFPSSQHTPLQGMSECLSEFVRVGWFHGMACTVARKLH